MDYQCGAPADKVIFIKKSELESPSNKKSKTIRVNKHQVAKAKAILKSVKDINFQRINAKKIFKENCKSCHGHTGKLGTNGANDLSKSSISLEETIAQIFYGRGVMIPYKDVLSAEEVVAVAKYTKTLRK